MPYINIDLDEIYFDLSRNEKKQLVEWLEKDGFISKLEKSIQIPSYSECDFNESLVSMIGKRHMLTNEEESIIIKMSNKFTNERK